MMGVEELAQLRESDVEGRATVTEMSHVMRRTWAHLRARGTALWGSAGHPNDSGPAETRRRHGETSSTRTWRAASRMRGTLCAARQGVVERERDRLASPTALFPRSLLFSHPMAAWVRPSRGLRDRAV